MFGLIPSGLTRAHPPIAFSFWRWRDRAKEMKSHNASHIAGVISLSCTLRGFNVVPLYGRPKLCLTGLGPHNDSLICKLIQVCNWPSIETAGALNSKALPFFYDFCSAECHARRRDSSTVWGNAAGGTGRDGGREHNKTEKKEKRART